MNAYSFDIDGAFPPPTASPVTSKSSKCSTCLVERHSGTSIPLKSREVQADVYADARFSACKENLCFFPETDAQVTFKFPLPPRTVVHRFEATMGMRVLRTEVKPAVQAETEFHEAVRQGHSAAKVKQEPESEIYTVDLGNLTANEMCVVRIHYLSLLPCIAGVLEWVHTATWVPPYIEPKLDAGSQQKASSAMPRFAKEVSYTLSYTVHVYSCTGAHSIKSAEAIDVAEGEPGNGGHCIVTLSSNVADPARDFRLMVELAQHESTPLGTFTLQRCQRGSHTKTVGLASIYIPRQQQRPLPQHGHFPAVAAGAGASTAVALPQHGHAHGHFSAVAAGAGASTAVALPEHGHAHGHFSAVAAGTGASTAGAPTNHISAVAAGTGASAAGATPAHLSHAAGTGASAAAASPSHTSVVAGMGASTAGASQAQQQEHQEPAPKRRKMTSLFETAFKPMDWSGMNMNTHLNTQQPEGARRTQKELVLVVDCSGSMSGSPIAYARDAALYFVRDLPVDVRIKFQIVLFGSSQKQMFSASQDYEAQSERCALHWIDANVQAIFGGTRIYDTLKMVYDTPIPSGYERQVIFLTDGGAAQQHIHIERLLQTHIQAAKTTILCLGIGHGVHRGLVDMMADTTGGLSQYVSSPQDIVRTCSYLKKCALTSDDVLLQPRLKPRLCMLRSAPAVLPPRLFAGEQLLVLTEVLKAEEGAALELHAVRKSGEEVCVHIPIPSPSEDIASTAARAGEGTQVYQLGGDALAALHAMVCIKSLLNGTSALHLEPDGTPVKRSIPQELIKDQIINLATEEGLVSPYTSAVGVLLQADPKDPSKTQHMEVPLKLPEGRAMCGSTTPSGETSRGQPRIIRASLRASRRDTDLGSTPDPDTLDKHERRILMNRQSAQRSKGRRLDNLASLEGSLAENNKAIEDMRQELRQHQSSQHASFQGMGKRSQTSATEGLTCLSGKGNEVDSTLDPSRMAFYCTDSHGRHLPRTRNTEGRTSPCTSPVKSQHAGYDNDFDGMDQVFPSVLEGLDNSALLADTKQQPRQQQQQHQQVHEQQHSQPVSALLGSGSGPNNTNNECGAPSQGLMLPPRGRLLHHQRSSLDTLLHDEKKAEPEDLLAAVCEEESPPSWPLPKDLEAWAPLGPPEEADPILDGLLHLADPERHPVSPPSEPAAAAATAKGKPKAEGKDGFSRIERLESRRRDLVCGTLNLFEDKSDDNSAMVPPYQPGPPPLGRLPRATTSLHKLRHWRQDSPTEEVKPDDGLPAPRRKKSHGISRDLTEEEKRSMRVMANRQSVRKSRQSELDYTASLERRVAETTKAVEDMRRELQQHQSSQHINLRGVAAEQLASQQGLGEGHFALASHSIAKQQDYSVPAAPMPTATQDLAALLTPGAAISTSCTRFCCPTSPDTPIQPHGDVEEPEPVTHY